MSTGQERLYVASRIVSGVADCLNDYGSSGGNIDLFALNECIDGLRNTLRNGSIRTTLTGRRARSDRQPERLKGSIRKSTEVSQRPGFTYFTVVTKLMSQFGL